MKILLIDSDREFRERVVNQWSVPDTQITESRGGEGAIQLISSGELGCVFLSTEFLTIENLDILALIKERNIGVEIFILTDRSDTARAEEAVRRGAHSLLIRPLDVSLMETLVRKAIHRAIARQNHRTLEEHVMMDLLGSTQAMEKILSTVAKVAPTNSSILIEGDTGTGKEFLANLIHRLSHRSEEPFVAVNCTAIPESLMEAELFGAKKGAYTGAVSDRKGLFEEADTGTLFLDEIGDLPMSLQSKLLRFIQEREFRRVGDTEMRYVDVRVIAATNKNLGKAVSTGDFREDLFYRLNIFHLRLPPLRERRPAIPHLIRYFVKKFGKQHGTTIKGIARDAESLLLNYDYPGNIRELENFIEHAVVLCEGNYILKTHLPESLTREAEGASVLSLPKSGNLESDANYIPPLAQLEKNHIIRALQKLGNNQTEVAKRLGISRSTLWRKVKEHGIAV